MNCFKTFFLAGSLTLCLPGLSNASENRFQFEKTADGYIRFDGNTGKIDICKSKNDEIVCALNPDERAAYEAEIEKLKAQIAQMEAKTQQNGSSRLPSRKEMDETFDAMKYFLDKFRDSFSDGQTKKNPPTDHL